MTSISLITDQNQNELLELIQRVSSGIQERGFVRIRMIAEIYDLSDLEWNALHYAFIQTQFKQHADKHSERIISDVKLLLNHIIDPVKVERPTFDKSIPVFHLDHQIPFLRGIITEKNGTEFWFLFIPENSPGVEFRIPYDKEIAYDLDHMRLPVLTSLVGFKMNKDHEVNVDHIILMPDLLVQVTQLTSFYPGNWPLYMDFIPWFFPNEIKPASLLGNAVNRMLDMKIRHPELQQDELIRDVFKSDPLSYCLYDDNQIKILVKEMKEHIQNLTSTIESQFPLEGIIPKQCVIEPSFFSPRFGLQGRLDLYQYPGGKTNGKIIELKSSKIFVQPGQSINEEHARQTLLYELLVSSTISSQEHDAYILYSRLTKGGLRKAKQDKKVRNQLIDLRNRFATLEYILARLDQKEYEHVFESVSQEWVKDVVPYNITKYRNWIENYNQLQPEEQYYFLAFVAFIGREHIIARIGNGDQDRSGGVAKLWLDTTDIKEDRFELLKELELVKLSGEKNRTILEFARTNQTSTMANFRNGDIVVLYPCQNSNSIDPTTYQILRGSITEINGVVISVRLRDAQIDTHRINQNKYWNIESDLLESSFRRQYQFNWKIMESERGERKIILGLAPPPMPFEKENVAVPSFLHPSQYEVFVEGAKASRLYFLWGPPGTGKTSAMMKAWVWEAIRDIPVKKVLLLAYTNRAVDEICEMLATLTEVRNQYIRIGSHDSTSPQFHDSLLDTRIQNLDTRKEIVDLIKSTNVFVATVHSIMGKSQLFELVDFDLLIIDEASQLLEPMVTGLIAVTKKSILIGDHKQLPAVSQQTDQNSRIREDQNWANYFQLTDLKMSYFERMYRLYKLNNWNYAIGELKMQGRMHRDIMQLINKPMYDGELECFPDDKYIKPLFKEVEKGVSMLFSNRVLHMPVLDPESGMFSKVSRKEVDYVLECITEWQRKLKDNGLNFSIGVITPFRAQIAAIQSRAFELNIDLTNVMVDTVERYQGGAKDIIILSTVVQHKSNLERIISPDQEGLDRKLNVAITRAREQFVLIGNSIVLQEEKLYRSLIDNSVALTSIN